MANDKLTPAEALHANAMRLKQQLDAGMEAKMNRSHDVGSPVPTPVLRVDQRWQQPSDNGGSPPPAIERK